MDTIFYWTGAMVWGTVSGIVGLFVLFLVSRVMLATLDVAAQMVRAWRRGQPRSEYYTPVSRIWIQQFFSGSWRELVQHVKRAAGPVTPWVKDEHLAARRYTVVD